MYKGSEVKWDMIWRETVASSVCHKALSDRYDGTYGLPLFHAKSCFIAPHFLCTHNDRKSGIHAWNRYAVYRDKKINVRLLLSFFNFIPYRYICFLIFPQRPFVEDLLSFLSGGHWNPLLPHKRSNRWLSYRGNLFVLFTPFLIRRQSAEWCSSGKRSAPAFFPLFFILNIFNQSVLHWQIGKAYTPRAGAPEEDDATEDLQVSHGQNVALSGPAGRAGYRRDPSYAAKKR